LLAQTLMEVELAFPEQPPGA